KVGKEPRAKETAKTRPDTAPGAAAPGGPPPTAPAASDERKKKKPGRAPARGKKLNNQLKNVRQRLAKEGPVPLKKAVGLLKQIKRAKFDETVEVHMNLGIDTTQSDQMIRGSVGLPHGLGKVKRVVVFCQGDNVGRAREAGADFAGGDDLIEK